MRALIVIDCQNDFITGTLAVPKAAEIIPVINNLQKKFGVVIYTQDWHPADHSSFKDNGGIWPAHCVQGTNGADFHPDIQVSPDGQKGSTYSYDIVRKGMDKAVDSYSGFYDNERKHQTELKETLTDYGITEVYLTGLATDYCVLYTALDAVAEGFKTFVVIDACRAVNINLGDDSRAIMEMIRAGVSIVHSKNI
jgi:nicotinamidase/pyrazinamidase